MEFELESPRVKQINSHIWLLDDAGRATGYVVKGKRKALVIDTMTGLCNVREAAEKLTDLPLLCINTHGHPDHIGGNWSFESAYLNPKDFALAKSALGMEEYRAAIEKHNLHYPEFVGVQEGDVFDLGGIELSVLEASGHTAGEIVLLDKADKILFSGDAILEQLWLQLPESTGIAEQIKSMERLEKYRGNFDTILSGHSKGTEDASLFDNLLSALRDLASGDNESDEEYEWFGGKCAAHPYGKPPRRIAYQKAR